LAYTADMRIMPRGGPRKGAGRKKEFDGAYLLKYRKDQRRRWERKATGEEKDLSQWMRDTLDKAAPK